MLAQLVERDMLLTELRPPTDSPDPVGHVLDLLARLPGLPELPALRAIPGLLAEYAATPLGSGRPAWRALTDQQRRLHTDDRLSQVDLRFDADVVLPGAVVAEVERAAAVLWRLAPDRTGPAHLRRWHAEFLDRYGTDGLVGVREVLDAERGLGPPAGYRMPAGHRQAEPEPAAPPSDRSRRLVTLAQDALLDRRREVLLDEAAVRGLERGSAGNPPGSVELYAQLLADSLSTMDAGEFRLVLGLGTGPRPAGSTVGRFAGLLDGGRGLRELAGAAAATDPAALHVQLACPVTVPRMANVAQVPRLFPDQVRVGLAADPTDPHTLPLDDLLVGADETGLALYSRSRGRRVVPVSYHMLNEQWALPNAARLLREIALSGVRLWQGWGWDEAADLPYLPRVRYGRVILESARWLPPELPDAGYPAWLAGFERWRERWQVPDRVHVALGDQRLELNLTAPLHLRLLRQELRRNRHTLLFEPPAGGEFGTGWLDGHASELVFPLVASRPAIHPAARPVRAAAPRPAPAAVHLPGGEWLYAKLYASTELHDELLTEALPALLAALPSTVDRWFFLRYRDPGPHLRLRFHGPADTLAGELLPLVHDWAGQLCRDGLAARLALDGYQPELARYGGPAVIELAEAAFQADSEAVLDQLRLRRQGRLDLAAELLVAANVVDILHSSGEPGWADRLVVPAGDGAALAAFRAHRAAALSLIDPAGGWAGLRDAAADLPACWAGRRSAVAGYLAALRGTGGNPATVLSGLIHLHHNRMVGIDPHCEARSYAIARGAVRAHRDRARHTP
jgi:thiopeptide-type bacteriocin biosynthesis protein